MRHVAILAVVACCGCQGPTAPSWPERSVPPWMNQARFAITDNLSDQLSFVGADVRTPTKLGAVPIGNVPVEAEGPHHLAASPDGRYLYVNLSNYVPGTGSGPHGSHGTGTVPGSVLKLDALTLAKVDEVLVDRSPGDIRLSRDGRLAFVSHYDLVRLVDHLTRGGPIEDAYGTLAIIETQTMSRISLTPVCVTPHGIGLSADEKTLYVTCAQSDELAIVDVADSGAPRVIRRLHVGPAPGPVAQPGYSPYALAVSPTDGSVWISNNISRDVRVFEPRTMEMDAGRTISLGGVAMFGQFTGDGLTFFVPHQGDDQITAVDTKTLATRELPVPKEACLNAHALVFTPDEGGAILVCEGDKVTLPGTAVFIQLPAFAITGFVTAGFFSDGAAWLPPLTP